jgi:GxxExxY protein
MKHEKLTAAIVAAAFEVANELGAGFLESVYQNALLLSLATHRLKAKGQYALEVRYQGQIVGSFFADILVEDLVIVELKAAKDIAPEHEAQLLNYLKATGAPVGMVINFGQPKLQFRRYENRFNGHCDQPD